MSFNAHTTTELHGVANDHPAPALAVAGLGIAFGGLVALQNVSFHVDEGEVVAVIGPNGAGKTTLFNCITGLYACEGKVHFGGADISGTTPHQRAKAGIGRTFQAPVVVDEFTVLDNVMIGAHHHTRSGYVSSMLGRNRREDDRTRSDALATLDHLGIAEVAGRRAGDLPHGLRKRVELARMLMTKPRLLLLDEPASGLDRREAEETGEWIAAIRATHSVSVLVVEHNLRLVMNTADRIVVLNFGEVLSVGTPSVVRQDADVLAAYLGGVE